MNLASPVGGRDWDTGEGTPRGLGVGGWLVHHSIVVCLCFCLISLRAELHALCAGLVSSKRFPPRASGVTWSRVKARACVGGRVMFIGCPHSQHVACSGFLSSLFRSLATRWLHL